MNVGIITIHAAHNYGAMLQAYASKSVVDKLGHEAHIIDFCPKSVCRRNRKIIWTRSPRQWAKNFVFMSHSMEWKRRYARYEQFKNRLFDLTERYESNATLERNPPVFDAYITGSDQVWNIENGLNPVWLLDFVKEGRKISYAPSFGTGFVTPQYRGIFQKYLPLYDALSCREIRGVEMIHEMTGLHAEHVLDPTLLLSAEEWGEVASGPVVQGPGPYLLVYCLEESPEFMKLVPKAAGRTGLPVVVISGSAINRFSCASRVIRDAGPAEFLRLFRDASLICTNSFHGTAFAINFKKNFISVPHTTRNSRLSSLLKLTGLERRQPACAAALDEWGDSDFEIDYQTAGVLLQQQINHSLNFLKKALA